jgi:hypothetical protein
MNAMQEKVVIEQSTVSANKSSTSSVTAETLSALASFGPPPLLEGEDSKAYDELLARVSGKVAPTDVLEEIWVRDVVDYTWEAFRWRRLKTRLITSTGHQGIEAVLKPTLPWQDVLSASASARDWASRDPDKMKEVRHELASANISMDDVWAHTVVANLSAIESLDRMTMHAEARRNAVLREVERHRTNFGKALRQASEAEDAEFTVVNKAQIEDKKAV